MSFAKVGGLGDVITALGKAIQEEGHKVDVVLPKYDCITYELVEDLRRVEKSDFVWNNTRIRTWMGIVEGLRVHFIEPENGIFWAGCIYGRNDDPFRYICM